MAKQGYGTVRELLGWPPDEALSVDQQATLRGLYFYQVAQDVRRGIHDDLEDKRIEVLNKQK
ncbi:hypothetical protein EHF33_20715 (plasmid) [Deinococcus psychrotolerans]|uniref:Uncharacterized protein n=1 Tax=Deinococcus psychrotolerans TaxID=2489213 RepID=A0A3G8YKB9_9DEIO|nr:hypothetical protein [Deinococcus psychrotolerans]AZI45335.1 hypothetical protein EHF33_20715 [Deinococcus psychrotolerans]